MFRNLSQSSVNTMLGKDSSLGLDGKWDRPPMLWT